jgi:HlyD family secretion protein
MWPARRTYRNLALDRLESPDQLDAMLRVIDPRVWVAHGLLLGVIGIFLLWSLFGSVATTRTARGLLVGLDAPVRVVMPGQAIITELLVAPGDTVAEHQAVARVSLPTLTAERAKAQAELESLRLAHARASEFSQREEAVRKQLDDAAILRAERTMSEPGPTPLSAAELAALRERIENLRAQAKLRELEADRAAFEQRLEEDQLEARLARVTQQLAEATELRSPVAGRVAEVASLTGGAIAPGGPVVLVQPGEQGRELLAARLVASSRSVLGIKPGMRAFVVPEALGRGPGEPLMGRVKSVSDLRPAGGSTGSVIAGTGPFESMVSIDIEIESDPAIPNRARRAGGFVAGSMIAPGTPCSAVIELDRRRPISVLIPRLSEATGER